MISLYLLKRVWTGWKHFSQPAADIVRAESALPSKVDKLTDEEGFDDTETLDPSVRDVACSIEISVPYENHDDHREKDLSNKSKKRSCSEPGSDKRKKGKKELISDWKKVPSNYNFLIKVTPQK
ncbi:uncharacterized protein TNIN_45511 [Trichonephila inaurata madagascariensis]|uniref:Uncharacterized protein n=1 Tax=Trichonephila inaurata madagascariensis TaxID=2747483 RepID=A0A8X6YMC1_9ARAC|nr:uncharacterized protein TNIN_45511 [Trichonephila inaurata madagascariensis]